MPDPEVRERPVRRTFTAAYKLRIVEEANAASEPGAIGALLRREGLYSSHPVEWRRLYRAGALSGLARPRGRPAPNPLAAENDRLRSAIDRVGIGNPDPVMRPPRGTRGRARRPGPSGGRRAG